MAEIRVTEPKASKCGLLYTRKVKDGNRVLGTIETPKMKLGAAPQSIFWGVEGVLFLSNRDATMYVSRPAVASLRTYGVAFIGLKYSDGTSYSTPIDTLSSPCATRTNAWSRPCFAVPLDMWEHTLPKEEDRVGRTLEKMRIPGGRKPQSTLTNE